MSETTLVYRKLCFVSGMVDNRDAIQFDTSQRLLLLQEHTRSWSRLPDRCTQGFITLPVVDGRPTTRYILESHMVTMSLHSDLWQLHLERLPALYEDDVIACKSIDVPPDAGVQMVFSVSPRQDLLVRLRSRSVIIKLN
jgi:hypothetical protein